MDVTFSASFQRLSTQVMISVTPGLKKVARLYAKRTGRILSGLRREPGGEDEEQGVVRFPVNAVVVCFA
jgi:hypothetical protein